MLEAQELAIREHNIEFKSNLWVSYSTCTNAIRVKGVRKHMGTRMGIINYKYSHYYVRLEEGRAPANFASEFDIYESRAKQYIEKLRKRSVFLSHSWHAIMSCDISNKSFWAMIALLFF